MRGKEGSGVNENLTLQPDNHSHEIIITIMFFLSSCLGTKKKAHKRSRIISDIHKPVAAENKQNPYAAESYPTICSSEYLQLEQAAEGDRHSW